MSAIGGLEQGGVLDAGVDGVGIGQGGFEMPDAFEFPGVGFAVVPLVGAGDAIVNEFVAFTFRHALGRLRYSAARRFPCFAAVTGALDDLSEPTAGLGGVNPVGVDGGAFKVVDFPAAEVGAVDLPFLAFGVGGEDECAFSCADEYADLAHGVLLLVNSWIVPRAAIGENGRNPKRRTRRRRRIDCR